MSSDDFFAYEKELHGLEAVMRMHSVKRWHMIDTTRQQTLAEHSANVALLAGYIAHTCPGMHFGPSQPIVVAALIHDLPEVFTGDIPTGTKRHIQGVDRFEERVTPEEFKRMIWPDPVAKDLIKVCDLADGIRFIRLHGVDVTARHAREGLQKQLNDRFAAVQWPDEVHHHVKFNCSFYAYERS